MDWNTKFVFIKKFYTYSSNSSCTYKLFGYFIQSSCVDSWNSLINVTAFTSVATSSIVTVRVQAFVSFYSAQDGHLLPTVLVMVASACPIGGCSLDSFEGCTNVHTIQRQISDRLPQSRILQNQLNGQSFGLGFISRHTLLGCFFTTKQYSTCADLGRCKPQRDADTGVVESIGFLGIKTEFVLALPLHYMRVVNINH